MKAGKELEELTSKLLKDEGFNVKKNFIVSNRDRKFEIDVLANKKNYYLVIECKDHKYISPKEQEEIINALKIKASNISGKKLFILVERGYEFKQLGENEYVIGIDVFIHFINKINLLYY